MNKKLSSSYLLCDALFARRSQIEAWFREKWISTPPTFYGSIDLRDAGYKIAPVDTNLFPAGFNNLPSAFTSIYIQAVKTAISKTYGNAKNILLIPESHTRNTFYLENLAMLRQIIASSGYEVKIGSFRQDLINSEEYSLSSGKLTIDQLKRDKNRLYVQGFYPDLIILNNDLSSGVPPILDGVEQKIIPSVKLGWFNRLKSEYFKYYQSIVEEFSLAFSIDPWLIQTYFQYCKDISFQDEKNLNCLVAHAEDLLLMINKKYKDYGIKQEPFLVVKADTGTYGMAVMVIKDPHELCRLNRKQKNKMAYTKGGQLVSRAIVQEGVYSVNKINKTQQIAEPVIYLIGDQVIGGFYRGHRTHTSIANLNTKGMFFSSFSKKDIETLLDGSAENKVASRFYLYNVISRLAFLAASHELISLTE
jgi:glutamate--cysteine ligase